MLLIVYLYISKVLLVLGDFYGEKEDFESFRYFNIESLYIVFSIRKEFYFILDVFFSIVVNLELFNIKCVLDDNRCFYFLNVLLKF